MEYKQIKDNEQWLYAIKSNKPVRFTDEFKKIVGDKFPSDMMDKIYTTTSILKAEREMLSQLDKFDDKELDIVRYMVWDERKFNIIEVEV